MKHEHSDIFDLLRRERALLLDDIMAELIANEGKNADDGDALSLAAGRRFAHSVAVTYHLEGVEMLYKFLRGDPVFIADNERPEAADIVTRFEDAKSKCADPRAFAAAAERFCVLSGVSI